MKEVNGYYKSYDESNRRINYLKYGILNEFGHNLEGTNVTKYDEEEIIKKN